MKKIVIVTPLLNEEENIDKFFRTVSTITSAISGFTFHYMFVNDGSIDKSWRVIEKLTRKHKNISAIKLSRNFGSHEAILAGIESAVTKLKFDYIVISTIDLQNPPNLISKMIDKLNRETRVVWGVRSNREGEGLSAMFSNIYYRLIKSFALSNMPVGGTDYCIFDKRVATDLVNFAEKNTSIFGLILWLGYDQKMIPYIRKAVPGRISRWSFSKKLKLLKDSFVSFSYAPIWFVTYLGFLISATGFVYAAFIFVRRLFYNIKIEGWSSLMLITLLLSGIQLIMLGIVAEYLWRTLDTARRRPIYLVDKKINI